ncbi:glycosyl transferase group 1 [Intrasporangium calvum DSM 43043]|uniref:Glycosyl transferase group 1 n=1 Tax=Intrasporangium calvum (strain ATCC 23552 / DSM 43043 / JCM 3097 / NBRC 12989 / NCIMB 10167 / NRRL B-3866 / 7 KIP) TaxID=710696 RepID=E6SEV4_INTC7|nr:glycosyl transferase group 1 [Intrasporangium calvum DSM 43043]
MPRLTIATVAAEHPMGAQVYEAEIAHRADAALAAVDGEGWQARRLTVRSFRAATPGNRRLPMGWVTTTSPAARRELGRLLYAGDTVSHRTNLELPPSPRADVVTLHDVVAWKFPDESAPVAAARDELRRAAAVICVSHFSAAEAVELLGIEAPHVVHNGVDSRFFDPSSAHPEVLHRLGVDGAYVLVTGGASARKNLEGLAVAWQEVSRARPDLTLVLSGPEHPRRTALFADVPSARLVGRVNGSLLPSLVAGSSALVVPSHYEGFGLPALEGMAAGVPVVAARTSSLPEVVGDGGLLVDPTPRGLSGGILVAVSGESEVLAMARRGRRRAEAFTWEESARRHAEVWSAVARSCA